jgi:hypothetical protein
MISVNNSKADRGLHAHLASRDGPHDVIVPAMAGAFVASLPRFIEGHHS